MPVTPNLSLQAFERLKSRKQIALLFEEGQSTFVFPFKIVYIIQPRAKEGWPLSFTVSVPKRRFKKAVQRNLIKRRTKEAYRLNKAELQENLMSKNIKISLIFIYLDSEVKKFAVIEKSIKHHLNALQTQISTFS